MAYIDYPETQPLVEGIGINNLQWIDATDFIFNEPIVRSPQYVLVYDGWRRNEERSSLALDGSLLGKGLGKDAGDRITYNVQVSEGKETGAICFRYKVDEGGKAVFDLKGLIEKRISFEGTGSFDLLSIPYQCNAPGEYTLELVSQGNGSIELDGFFIGSAKDIDQIKIVPKAIQFTPLLETGKQRQDFILKYPELDNYYGVAWNFDKSVIREVLNSDLESFFRRKVHDHMAKTLVGDKAWHYTNAFLRPIVLKPGSEQTLYMLVCTGSQDQVSRSIHNFHTSPEQLIREKTEEKDCENEKLLPGAEEFKFSRRLLQAALLSNVVYPVYTQQEYIRHFTPGKNWNSLYTWDLGFIALGMLEIDKVKAFECIRAYTTPVGSESAFIHHGTPLPIQMFAYYDLWNNSQSMESLQFLYPRLKQYFDFMVGNNPYSNTCIKGSGLLKSWDYFYNSGGWDDYPPQHALRGDKSQYRYVAPVVTSAYYLRAAKILRFAAKELGLKEDIKLYDQTIKSLSKALLKYAWDEESGYFGYTVHDSTGTVSDIYRYKDGSNFNKGLDGVTPLVAGICSPQQTERIVGHLFSEREMWTKTGISTVDQSASYYDPDGYWNGAVWFPHQWVMWKSLLDAGRGEEAHKIARTALENWKRECEESYFTFEHFIISSGRGAGWHQFSGLSSPILNWFAAYFKIGKVSTGFEVWIEGNKFNNDYSRYEASVSFDDSIIPHERCIIVCMNPDYHYMVHLNGKTVKSRAYYPGLVEIMLPETNKSGILTITKSQ